VRTMNRWLAAGVAGISFASCGAVQNADISGLFAPRNATESVLSRLQPAGRSLGVASGGSSVLASSYIPDGAKASDLLYIADAYDDRVDVYKWPHGGSQIGTLSIPAPEGVCSTGANGSVWVTSNTGALIVEYPHGSSRASRELVDPYDPVSCAVDPSTGNLAVTNVDIGYSGQGNVVVYLKAKGKPKIYTSNDVYFPFYCAYDGSGNLYFDGEGPGGRGSFAFGELPRGGSAIQSIALDQSISFPGGVQWDGKYIVVGDQLAIPETVYQFEIASGNGSEVGSTKLDGPLDIEDFAIAGSKLIGPESCHGASAVWRYPQGGAEQRSYLHEGCATGATVSYK
jgi:hypothetical protein